MKKKERRWTVVADKGIQMRLCARIFFYWVACQCSFAVAIFSIAALQGPEPTGSVTRFIVPALLISMLVLPIALFDVLVFSNRFVGPISQLRSKMNSLVNENTCEKVHFRRGDFYGELSQNFNILREQIQENNEPAAVRQPERELETAFSNDL